MGKVFIIFVLCAGTGALAESLDATFVDDGKTRVELGAGLGFPALFNATAAVWFEKGLVARVSGFPWYVVNGIQLDIGMATKREGQSRQYVALSAGHLNADRLVGKQNFTYIGPKYGWNWSGIFFDVGVAYAWGQESSRALNRQTEQRNLMLPYFQLGYTPFFF